MLQVMSDAVAQAVTVRPGTDIDQGPTSPPGGALVSHMYVSMLTSDWSAGLKAACGGPNVSTNPSTASRARLGGLIWSKRQRNEPQKVSLIASPRQPSPVGAGNRQPMSGCQHS